MTGKQVEIMRNYKTYIDNSNVDRLPSTFNFYSTSFDLSAIWGEYTDGNLVRLFHEVAEIYAPTSIIADRVAGANWQLRKLSDDSIVTNNKYMERLMQQPNPIQNWQDFIQMSEIYELITGKSYIYANVPTGMQVSYRNIATLINLPSDGVQIQLQPILKLLSATTKEDLIQHYLCSDGWNGLNTIMPEFVLYSKFSSIESRDYGIIGKSPLLSAQKAVSNLLAVYSARNVIYTKRGALGMLVSKKGDDTGLQPLTANEKKRAIDDYNNTYGVTNSKSPVGITDVPLEFIKIAATIQELEPFTETEHDAAAIYATYKVPRELMPRQEGSKYENQAAAEKSVYENVVIPRAQKKAQSLTNFLKLNEMGMYLHADFSHVNVLQENKKEKAEVDWRNNETCRVQFIHGLITLNDWRIKLGYQAIANSFYEKLLYDMSPEELAKVMEIIKLKGNDGSTQQQNVSPDQQQNNAQ